MSRRAMPSAIVFGGSGFLGSHIVERLCRLGSRVTVIDGLLTDTGGSLHNLSACIDSLSFIGSEIGSLSNLPKLLSDHEVVIDCMGWTRHRAALENPAYDARLNVESHLQLLLALRESGLTRPIILLASRGQYGNPPVNEILETTPMHPVDVQGIHKLTAELYYQTYARLLRLNVISLRISNCFGVRQPRGGDDIGLIGGFIRDLLSGKEVEIFGQRRFRHLVYAPDLAEVIVKLIQQPLSGFEAFNYGGQRASLKEVVSLLARIIGSGGYIFKEFPEEIKQIDIGNAVFNQDKLQSFVGPLPCTPLDDALVATVEYFRKAQHERTA